MNILCRRPPDLLDVRSKRLSHLVSNPLHEKPQRILHLQVAVLDHAQALRAQGGLP